MAIIGFDDTPRLRRNGKIRAGYKDEKTNKLINTDYFLLHDAPGVSLSLGEKPTEIYFTLYTDDINAIYRTDLRWYNSSQLMCVSMHGAADENGLDMGSVAAFKGVGLDVKGLMQKPFPRIDEARIRKCAYKACPEYMQNKCGEHMFLDFVIPQKSMAEVYTLDSVSVNAILNARDVLMKCMMKYNRVSGQIFKMYKSPGEITYQKRDGTKGKSEAQMVSFSVVDFAEYEAKFKSSISPEDWQALINLREGGYGSGLQSRTYVGLPSSPMAALPAADQVPQIAQQAQSFGIKEDDEAELLAKANDPAILPYFEEYGKLIDKEPTEKIRMATMKQIATVADGIEYLKKRIKEAKKTKGSSTATPPLAAAAETPKDESIPSGPTAEGGATSLY